MAIIAMLWAVRNRILYILVRLDCNGNIQRVIDADRPLVRPGFRISSDFQRDYARASPGITIEKAVREFLEDEEARQLAQNHDLSKQDVV